MPTPPEVLPVLGTLLVGRFETRLDWFVGKLVEAIRLRFLKLEPLKTFGLRQISPCFGFGGLPLLLLCCVGWDNSKGTVELC